MMTRYKVKKEISTKFEEIIKNTPHFWHYWDQHKKISHLKIGTSGNEKSHLWITLSIEEETIMEISNIYN